MAARLARLARWMCWQPRAEPAPQALTALALPGPSSRRSAPAQMLAYTALLALVSCTFQACL